MMESGTSSFCEKLLAGLGALAGVVAVSLNVYTHYKGSSHRRFVRNINKKLNSPFIPLYPAYGPVFRRPTWKKSFLEKVVSSETTQAYCCYYGASESGKTTALTQALKDITGVIYLPLRGVGSELSIPSRLAQSIGYFGKEEIDPKISMETLLHALKDACEEYKFNHQKRRVIVIVDDIHKQIDKSSSELNPLVADMAQEFVDLYSIGLMNVVYLVSEYHSVSIIKNLSGHSRLSIQVFPAIPDEELVQDFKELCRIEDDKEPSKWRFFEEGSLPPGYHYLFPVEDDVRYLVKHMGSHMGCLVDAIQKVAQKKSPVEKVVEECISGKVLL